MAWGAMSVSSIRATTTLTQNGDAVLTLAFDVAAGTVLTFYQHIADGLCAVYLNGARQVLDEQGAGDFTAKAGRESRLELTATKDLSEGDVIILEGRWV